LRGDFDSFDSSSIFFESRSASDGYDLRARAKIRRDLLEVSDGQDDIGGWHFVGGWIRDR